MSSSAALLMEILEEVTAVPRLDVSAVIHRTRTEWAQEVIKAKLRSVALRWEPTVIQDLTFYMDSFGTHRGSWLPQPGEVIHSLMAFCYRNILFSGERYGVRWALCRIILGAEGQRWWLHSPLSPADRHTMCAEICALYEHHWIPFFVLHGREAESHASLVVHPPVDSNDGWVTATIACVYTLPWPTATLKTRQSGSLGVVLCTPV
jgi:hypothetical protein